MKKSYSFSPRRIKRNTKFTKKESEYVRIIVRSFVLYIIIGVASFFVFFGIFSNINNLWGFFKPSEKYVEDNNIKPAKPFLKTEQEFTKKEKIDLEGIAETGKQVVLYKNGAKEAETIADAQNNYFFNDVSISTKEEDKTTFYTKVIGDKNVESASSNEVTVEFDKTKPKLEVLSPKPDDRIKSYSRTLEVTGKTEPDVIVLVNDKLARVNTSQEFSATIGLKDEVNDIKVVATDKAGNETVINVPVYFEKKSD